ncbi:protein DpdJ [Rheinheimera sp. UJ63]|uniref:protein DpdJ n=1 Tax=Rheinheimera sp. UJ63 TaxID=2910157 RepID=UPI001F4618CF|nr:protein DpdJ [Rheinheimera sp. UJ63]MCF4010632.1 DEAD/DEAH box helicase [Rheinheimera sp. UJ63]
MINEEDLRRCLDDCLDIIEQREYRLLAWGDTEVRHNKSEILEIIKSQTSQNAQDIFFELLKRCLIFSVADIFSPDAYRSRMAESVHLSKKLRQWFHGQSLQNTKTLVSDYRFIRRARTYPKRDIAPNFIVDEVCKSNKLSEKYRESLCAMLEGSHKLMLSGFQKRATIRILNKLTKKKNTTSATIVCAGTGSGKTLSFYLPALANLAVELTQNQESKVRILAIYPRKELLKDQFQETFHQARKLDPFLQRNNTRKIRIGTFFGDTWSKELLKKEMNKGSVSYNMLKCNCSGVLKWKKEDFDTNKEALICGVCGARHEGDVIALTRESPAPDILFTTTEMLNQHLGDGYSNHLFGANNQSIPLVLLDEVHTYEGSTGAQTSYLLKRWMKYTNSSPHFVGLSATLNNASKFFATFTGVTDEQVEAIEPLESEMLEEGAEYLLALRGDPVSQAALLSTTIQTTMLFQRMMDTKNHSVSKGTYGSKLFVFTDDLDVNNRLFEMMADAEGWEHAFKKLKPTKIPLAFLRSSKHPEFDTQKEQMDALGQNWSNCERIGHAMNEHARARVARTSSQDTGVDRDAEITIATASLEVGFNDPEVGTVIQHKSPRGMASYIQRKGRAGRTRGMRPWMITVLSDYGRDRIAFQRYESLVEPRIKSSKLPIDNSHIQKMQACLATLDWLSKKVGKTNLWAKLKKPQVDTTKTYFTNLRNVLETLNTNEQTINELKKYLMAALALSDEKIQQVFWQGPRSLRMDFIPNLLHKIETEWSVNGIKWKGLTTNGSPMPDFFPPTLFSELVLPSLNVCTLRGKKDERKQEWHDLPLFQGLKEFAPGRVSKRYSVNNSNESDWLVPETFSPTPGQDMKCSVEVQEAFGESAEPTKKIKLDLNCSIEIFKPKELFAKRLENKNITDKSNAFLNWGSDFFVDSDSHQFKIPQSSDWFEFLRSVCFFRHSQMCPIELTRYSTGSEATIKFKTGDSSNIDFNWVNNGSPVGVGTVFYVDGVSWKFHFSEQRLTELLKDPVLLKSLRGIYVEALFKESALFKNQFQGGWVLDCVTTAIYYLSHSQGRTIKSVIESISEPDIKRVICSIPLEVFQLKEVDEGNTEEQVLQKDIIGFLSNDNNLASLKPLLQFLYEENLATNNFVSWFRNILANTLCGGISATLHSLLPDVSETDINVDFEWARDNLTVWLTENEAGGVGIVSRFEEFYIDDPLSVLNHLSRSFEIGEYEQVNYDMHQLLIQLKKNKELEDAIKGFRQAYCYSERVSALMLLRSAISKLGIAQTHSFNSLMHTRLLKAGSTPKNDEELLDWLTQWEELENKFHLEIPLVAMAYLIAKKIEPKGEVNKLKDKVLALLWPKGQAIRQTSIQFYNRFAKTPNVFERLAVTRLFKDKVRFIEYTSNWKQDLLIALSSKDQGKVELRLGFEDVDKLNSIIFQINTVAIEYLGLLFHTRIIKIFRQKNYLSMHLEIAETIQ